MRELSRRHREEILAIARKHGVERVRLFGSAARGDEHSESDLDLLVRFAPDRGLVDLVDFSDEIRGLLGEKVDILTDHAMMQPRLRLRVERDAVPL